MRRENLVSRSCPACNSTAQVNIGEKNGFRLPLCQNCKTLYVARLPTGADAQDYDSYYQPSRFTAPAFIHARLDEIVADFSGYRKVNRLLDVGCGGGALLQAAARGGWDAEGLEVSKPAAEHVESLGFKVFSGLLSEAGYPDGYFDVVTASEVIEHVPDPQAVVAEIVRILRPGGLFWATTPHGRGASARALKLNWSIVSPPEHLQLFSVEGIKQMLTSVGFRQVRVAAHGVNPYEILHVLRASDADKKSNGQEENDSFDRVQSCYELNEAMTRSGIRRRAKGMVNGLLAASRLGDSLKIYAVK
jgi:2-polyprenyl-3-methyl-5-hydroxy-6-metoxy-1,4-benzoquinol methylase